VRSRGFFARHRVARASLPFPENPLFFVPSVSALYPAILVRFLVINKAPAWRQCGVLPSSFSWKEKVWRYLPPLLRLSPAWLFFFYKKVFTALDSKESLFLLHRFSIGMRNERSISLAIAQLFLFCSLVLLSFPSATREDVFPPDFHLSNNTFRAAFPRLLDVDPIMNFAYSSSFVFASGL